MRYRPVPSSAADTTCGEARAALGSVALAAMSTGPHHTPAGEDPATEEWPRVRAAVLRNAAGIGIATGAYGVSFGAIATAGGLSVLQACLISLVIFTGASRFALVSVLSGGGGQVAAAATAVLLGTRNADRKSTRLNSSHANISY